MSLYNKVYFENFRNTSRESARQVVPIVLDWVRPGSVIDLGSGMGCWLSVFKELGIGEICGVDGSYVERDRLAIPAESFVAHDLTQPYRAAREFDLAMSVEVAEHLPADCARTFVASLTSLAPIVLFSAAIPHQPGVHHVNAQWPAYWADLFAERDFVAIDALRHRIWNDPLIDWWYRQNLMMYVRRDRIGQYPDLAAQWRDDGTKPLPLVHPEMFRGVLDWGVEWEAKYWDLYARSTRAGVGTQGA